MLINKHNSFTLIEVLIFITILSVFFILAMTAVTVSLRTLKFNEHKIKASHYSRQLEDWLRAQREINWGGNLCGSCSPANFTEYVTPECFDPGSVCSAKIFCFNDLNITGWPSEGSCPDFGLNTFYKREAEFSSNPENGYISQVSAVIRTSWQEFGQLKSVVTNTAFSLPEQ